MAKALINKHIDSTLDVNRRDLFLEDPVLAKGEILINNDKDDPSIFIVNTENEVVKISAGEQYDDTEIKGQLNTIENTVSTVEGEVDILNNTVKTLQGEDSNMSIRSIAEDVVNKIGVDPSVTEKIDYIQDSLGNFTPDNTVESNIEIINQTVVENEKVTTTSLNKINDSVSALSGTLDGLITETEVLKDSVEILTGDAEGSLKKTIEDTKSIIDAYTINGLPISDNVVLDSDNITITDSYSTVNQVDENIIPGDIITTAISKIEVMLANTTLAITAAINDIDYRLGRFTEYNENGDPINEASGICKRIEDIEDVIINKSRD